MTITILSGCCLSMLAGIPDKSVNTCVTSPPYWGLRDYGHDGQLGAEKTPAEYVANMVNVFREVRRVLRDDGTLWLNLGDTYAAQRGGSTPPAQTVAGGVNGQGGQKERRGMAGGYNASRNASAYGLKHKDLVGIPWRVAFALQEDGWYLRSDIIWNKPNPMPESVTDRPTKSHEYVFLLSKNERYYYDHGAIKEDSVADHPSGNGFKRDARLSYKDNNGARGNDEQWNDIGGKRNRRTVWTVATKPYSEAHFATYPTELIEPCILAGSPKGGMVLDPFFGAGTTGLVCDRLGRNCTGIELNPEYVEIAKRRLTEDAGLFSDITAA